MNRRERTCATCGKIEWVFTRTNTCHECHIALKQQRSIQAERNRLEAMYDGVQGPYLNKHNQRTWTFTHKECGAQQTWNHYNILKQLKLRPDKIPCTHCGGKERMSKAMDVYVTKYGLTEEQLLQWNAYRQRVRGLTAKAYKEHQSIINPLNLKRGIHDHHLDHKIPVIEGFMKGYPPEQIAAVENLQMLKAFDNLSKGRSVI